MSEKEPFYNCHDYYHEMPDDFKMTAAYSTNQLMAFADGFADQRLEDVLEDAEKEIDNFFKINGAMSNLMQETIVDEKRGAKWILNHIKQQIKSNH